jgi:hypothetical protein
MANTFVVSRAQLIYAFCLPLAVLLGYLLADPMDRGSLAVVVLLVSVLAVPILMRWYHPMLLFTWNAVITPTFLPGQPYLWMLIAFVGLGFAVANRFTSPEAKFISVPSIHWPLLFLAGVLVATAWMRGGIGLRVLGSSQFGGRGYVYCFAALAGYFTLCSQRIPGERGPLYVALFFLAGVTALIPNLSYLAGKSAEFLFYFFPAMFAMEQAMGDFYMTEFARIYGLSILSNTLLCWLLARYGLRGTLDPSKPIRVLLFLVAFAACLFCGFRSAMVFFLLLLLVQFFFEGLCRPRTVAVGLGVLLIAGGLLLPNATRLPLVVQRTLSFLPVEISPIARQNADESSEWRLRMWQEVLPDVPKYLLKGKGYAIDPTALDFAFENAVRGYGTRYEWARVGGVYHNGPLSLVIPLGLWGVLAFGWFVVATLRQLVRAARHGEPNLREANVLLLSYFVTKLLIFLFVYGSFFDDLFFFTGIAGLSVSLNGAALAAPAPAEAMQGEEPAYGEGLAPEGSS